MSHDCAITAALLRRQKTMFRVAEKQFGLSQKIINLETGMSVSAIGQYARGETAMGAAAIMKLAHWRDFPVVCLNILFSGSGRFVNDEEEPDHDGHAARCIDFAAAHARARHPESECGVEIGPNEDSELRSKRAA